jgi:hypothetical protein
MSKRITRALPGLLADACVGDGFNVAWEVATPHLVRGLAQSGNVVVLSLTERGGEGAFMTLDARDGHRLRMVKDLPRVGTIAASADGWCVSSHRQRAGEPTGLHFFDSRFFTVRSTSFETTVAALACLPWGAVVATRDGLVRAFTAEGEPTWTWRVPGRSRGYPNSASLVSAVGERALIRAGDDLYALGSDGALHWHWRTPLRCADDAFEITADDIRAGNTGPSVFDPMLASIAELTSMLTGDCEAVETTERGISSFEREIEVQAEAQAADVLSMLESGARFFNRGGCLMGGTTNGIQSVVVSPKQLITVGDSQGALWYIDPTDGRTLGSARLDEPNRAVVLVPDSLGRVRAAISRTFRSTMLTTLDGAKTRGQNVMQEHHTGCGAIGGGVLTHSGQCLRGFDETAEARWSVRTSVLWPVAIDDTLIFNRQQRIVGVTSSL